MVNLWGSSFYPQVDLHQGWEFGAMALKKYQHILVSTRFLNFKARATRVIILSFGVVIMVSPGSGISCGMSGSGKQLRTSVLA